MKLTPHRRLSRAQSRQAQRHAKRKDDKRYETAGRAVPVDHEHTTVQIATRLVRQLAKIVDDAVVFDEHGHGQSLVAWTRGHILASYKGPGRPVEWPLRTMLIVCLIQAHLSRAFFLSDVQHLLRGLSWRVRRNLGLDYLRRNGTATTVSYDQFVDAFHRLARCFDGYEEGLEPHVRAERDANLQVFLSALIGSSGGRAPTWQGHAAIDATLKWAHERPPHSGTKKIERAGADGEDGKPVALSEITGGDESMFEPLDPSKHLASAIGASTNRARTWTGGANWVGRKTKSKSVFGYAVHTATSADAFGPSLVIDAQVTPAVGDAVEANEKLIVRINTRRLHTGESTLVSAVADPAYTTDRGLASMKRLGVEPTFRLHRTNQAGARLIEATRVRGGGPTAKKVLLVDGWPTCTCCPQELQDLPFPKWPPARREMSTYKANIAKREPFSYEPNGPTRRDGSRQFLAPHRNLHPGDDAPGGCPNCTNPDGTPALDPTTGLPRLRCCTKASVILDAAELVRAHEYPYATETWWPSWNIRNRVEGTFGILKNLAITNWRRDYHRYVGLAREALIVAFAICAHNYNQIRSWEAWMKARRDDTGGAMYAHGDADDYFFGPEEALGPAPEPAPEPDPPPKKRPRSKLLSFLED